MLTVDQTIEAFLDEHREERLESYKELLRIPSISTLPEHKPDIERAARWIVDELSRIGMEHATTFETHGGHPLVYGDWLHAAGAPTILVYCHYDVQPVDPIELWETAPFDPFVKDGRMVGRGAADDKGQLHMHVKAAEAILATRGSLPVNLKFLFEGEEEHSSVGLEGWLLDNRERLAADAIVISDTGFFEGNVPALTTSLRGMMYAQIDVSGPPIDLHSGGFGGAVQNPANALARIITELKSANGSVLVPGFYDDVVEPTREERFEISCLPFDEGDFHRQTGVPELVASEPGFSILECMGVRPTLDVNGIWGGFTGEGSKTIIPAHAHAKVSCRLVPDQDGEKIFEQFRDFVMKVAPRGVKVEVQNLGTAKALRMSPELPVSKAAARALEATFGQAPVSIRSGGSIPVSAMFDEVLGLPITMLGFTNPDDNAHAPNETMVLLNYETGLRTITRLWDDLGRMSPLEARMGGTTA
ncbi:MAG TPA: dipeptidase [Candidatus Limnocylindrales bacterium]|nr:dipeptidase [Candidatus Limnocylindrales bacterium]